MTNKKRLAIISTYDELCGIAGYTKALVPQLENDFEVEVFDLDQILFRHDSSRVQKRADQEIARICAELKNFDCVNIQLEHGTFGRKSKDICRRIKRIIQASPRICVTFHTVLSTEPFRLRGFLATTFKHGPAAAWQDYMSHRGTLRLEREIYGAIAGMQKSKPTSVIVHTRRDMRMLKLVHRIEKVFDHPLSFFDSDRYEQMLANVSRDQFAQLAKLPKDALVLGCFGFIGRYKGIDTAIKALRMSAPNVHLAIFGGLHPNEIKKNQEIDPFIQELLGEIQPNKKWIKTEEDDTTNISFTFNAKELVELEKLKHPDDLSDRVHFIGALSDADFPKAMAVCDAVLMPYKEVGQSSSGPMSIAVDLRKHIIAARTRAFMQFARYHPARFSMFEVGNYMELSQLINAQVSAERPAFDAPSYNTRTNATVYKAALLG